MAGFILLAQPPLVESLIPLSFDDPIFANVQNIAAGQTLGANETLEEFSIDTGFLESATGDPVVTGLNSATAQTIRRGRIRCREGVRVNANTGSLLIDQCYIDCADEDAIFGHSDSIQCFPAGNAGTVTVRNTNIVCNKDGAVAAVGNSAFFAADVWGGTIRFENVLLLGPGQRGIWINADPGATINLHVNEMYVVGFGDFNQAEFSFRAIGGVGVLNIVEWANVFEATIVGNTIVPGAPIVEPTVGP